MVKQGSSDLASLAWICHAEQLYIDAALVLDASTRVAAAARSGLIDLHFAFVVDHADGSQAASTCSCSVLRGSCLASLGWICDAEQRCTDAALVLDASTRVAAAARSGLIDLHFAFVDDHADGSQAASTRSCLVLQGS